MSLKLSEAELVEITGYKLPSFQLNVLHQRGFYRACMGRSGVVLERGHYDAVVGGKDAAPVKVKSINLAHLKAA